MSDNIVAGKAYYMRQTGKNKTRRGCLAQTTAEKRLLLQLCCSRLHFRTCARCTLLDLGIWCPRTRFANRLRNLTLHYNIWDKFLKGLGLNSYYVFHRWRAILRMDRLYHRCNISDG